MSGVDASVLHALYALRDPSAVQTFVWITELGSTVVIGGIALSAGLWLLLREHISYFAGLCVSILGTAGFVFALKELIERARPDVMYQAYLESGYSFPSGHAALSFALYGFLVYLAWKNLPRKQSIAIVALAIVLAGLIGLSRLYLGLHFLSDVLGGYAIAALFLGLGIWASERLNRNRI